eukprot:82817_1
MATKTIESTKPTEQHLQQIEQDTKESPLSIPDSLLTTLKEFDTNNDNYIDWQEFCALAQQKQFSDSERDQYWAHLGGQIHNNNSKISLEQFIFNREKYDDDDSTSYTKLSSRSKASRRSEEESQSMDNIPISAIKHRARSVPDTSDFSEYKDSKPRSLLRRTGSTKSASFVEIQSKLKTDPLSLFKEYDIEGNGSLTQNQFTNMITDIYINDNDDNKIKPTFAEIDTLNGNTGSFSYIDNVNNLGIALTKLQSLPNKYEFLKLCVEIFGNNNDEIK